MENHWQEKIYKTIIFACEASYGPTSDCEYKILSGSMCVQLSLESYMLYLCMNYIPLSWIMGLHKTISSLSICGLNFFIEQLIDDVEDASYEPNMNCEYMFRCDYNVVLLL